MTDFVDDDSWQHHLFKFLIFTVLGSGPSWTYGSLLVQEQPFFENSQPEELCIGSWMNVMLSFGLILSIIYFLFIKYVYAVPHEIGMPVLIAFAALSTFAIAFTYTSTFVFGDQSRSIALYIACFFSGTIGSLTYVVLLPFMTAYDDDAVTYARAGCDTLAILISLVAMIQNPGSETNVRFSPFYFYFGFGIYMLLPLAAYYYVSTTGYGLRNDTDMEKQAFFHGGLDEGFPIGNSTESESTHLLQSSHVAAAPKKSTSNAIPSSSNSTRRKNQPTQDEDENLIDNSHVGDLPTEALIISDYVSIGNGKEGSINNEADEEVDEHEWLLKLLPLMLTVGFIDFNTVRRLSCI